MKASRSPKEHVATGTLEQFLARKGFQVIAPVPKEAVSALRSKKEFAMYKLIPSSGWIIYWWLYSDGLEGDFEGHWEVQGGLDLTKTPYKLPLREQ